jgi:hypothetical protein
LNSGLPITEWHAHAYRVHYYENDGKPGRDATVYAPSVDFKFKNDTGNAILIQTEADTENNILKYTLWGKKDGRKVTISDVSILPGNDVWFVSTESGEMPVPVINDVIKKVEISEKCVYIKLLDGLIDLITSKKDEK